MSSRTLRALRHATVASLSVISIDPLPASTCCFSTQKDRHFWLVSSRLSFTIHLLCLDIYPLSSRGKTSSSSLESIQLENTQILNS